MYPLIYTSPGHIHRAGLPCGGLFLLRGILILALECLTFIEKSRFLVFYRRKIFLFPHLTEL